MTLNDDDFVLRPKRARGVPRERSPKPKVIVRKARFATRTYASRAIAKVTFANFTSLKAGTVASHLKYLARESAQSHQLGGAKSFGTCSPESFMKPLKAEKRVFKIVLSPTEFFTVDPVLYTHTFIREFQQRAGVRESGQMADWIAYVHTDTQNPHVHVLMHGVANQGKDLYFRRGVIQDASSLATRIQDRMTNWFPLSDGLLAERRAARRFEAMPVFENDSIDHILQMASAQVDWKGMLAKVPYYRRRGLHQRMVFLENHQLLMQDGGGKVVLAPNMFTSLGDLQRGLRQVRDSAKLNYLQQPTFELANSKTPKCFGLLTFPVAIGSLKRHYAVLETTKDTALAVRVPEGQLDHFIELARRKVLVRLRGGNVEPFQGDPIRLLRSGFHSTTVVARAVIAAKESGEPERRSQDQLVALGTRPTDLGH